MTGLGHSDGCYTMNLRNITRATTVGTRITIADTSLRRLQGLQPASGVHTFGMLFSIDVVALSKNLQVLKLWPRLAPFRVTSVSLKTHSILELPAGQISDCGIKVGDQLEFV